ncbi:hypothetical protein ABK040_009405 [Willaertia magna]
MSKSLLKDETIEWKDVTEVLKECTQKEFNLGEMLHHPKQFNLYDIMSAVEMMDPKMDLTVTMKEHVAFPSERFRKGFIPSIETLPIQSILYMMDTLLCATFTWFEGWSLSQSLFTCIYLHDNLKYIDEKCDYEDNKNIVRFFHSYASGIILIKELVEEVMTISSCREIEEFSLDQSGFYVKLNTKPNIVTQRIEKIEKELIERISNLKKGIKFYENIQENNEIELTILNALLNRISFIKNFVTIHLGLQSSTSPQISNVKKAITNSIPLLKQIQNEFTSLNLENYKIGFDKNIAIIASVATPLRVMELFTLERTIGLASKYFDDLNYIIGVVQIQSLAPFIHFFKLFSERDASVVSRAYLSHISLSNSLVFGKYRLQDWIENHIENELITLTDIHISNIKLQKTKPELLYQEWLDALAQAYIKLCIAFSHNRSRLRRVLAHLIHEFGLAEQRAEQIDVTWLKLDVNNPELIRKNETKFSLSLFMIDVIIDIMHQFLILGFELELYSHDEYAYVTWYIDYITKIRLMNFSKIYEENNNIKKLKDKTKKKTKVSKYYPYTKLVTELHSLFFRGFFRFIMAMVKKGLYTNSSIESELPFTTDALRYTNRFKPFFNTAQPPPVTYEAFVSSNDLSQIGASDLFNSAKDHFSAIQTAIETCFRQEVIKMQPTEKQQLEVLLKVAKTNAISVVVCSRLSPQDFKQNQTTPLTPIFDFSMSRLFPVLKPPKK